jgi:hypothetical protein
MESESKTEETEKEEGEYEEVEEVEDEISKDKQVTINIFV